jgi:hypothetical protein
MEWELVKPWVNRVGIMLEFLSFWFAAPEILGEERLRALELRLKRGIRVLQSALMILLAVGGIGTGLEWAGELLGVWMAPVERTSILGWARMWMGLMLGMIFWLNYSFHCASIGSKAEAGKWTNRRLLTALPVLWLLLWISVLVASVIVLIWAAWKAEAWIWVGSALLAALVLALEVVLGVRQPSEALAWAAIGAIATALQIVLMWEMTRTWRGVSLLAVPMGIVWLTVYKKAAPPLLRRLADDKRIRHRSLAVGAVLFVVGFLLQLVATF